MSRIWGKVIGGMLGFAIGGGPFGALLGVAAGHAYDERNQADGLPWKLAPEPAQSYFGNPQQEAFLSGVTALGAKMAKAEGRVTRAKIDAFKRAFQIKPADEARVGRLFDNARRSSEGFEPYAFRLSQVFCSNPSMLEHILTGLFLIAAAENNTVSPAENHFLKSVAFTFNLSPEDFKRIAARTGARLPSEEQTRAAAREVRRDSADDPYALLGIGAQASNEEVKNAYRALIRKHHPDRLAAEGVSAEFLANANEKMKRINVAYDTVCKMRGIK